MDNEKNQAIDLAEVRKYNASLTEYQNKSAQIKAEIDFNKKEIDRLCEEITAELGTEVNITNIESVYKEYTDKLRTTLSTGTEILQRITNDEAVMNSESQASNIAETSNPNTVGGGVNTIIPPPIQTTEGLFSSINSDSDTSLIGSLPKMF